MLVDILERARELYNAGQLLQAEIACRQALNQDRASVSAWFLFGAIARQGGRPEQAIQAFHEATRRKPEFSEAHNNLGICLAALGRLTEGAASFETAIKYRTNYSEAHNNLGNVLFNLGRVEEAIEHYRSALAESPRYAEAYNNLGMVQARRAHWAEAEASFRAAAEFRPNHPETHNNLGIALAAQQRRDEAIAAYEEAIRLKPDYDEAYANLGAALSAAGRSTEAMQCYRRAVERAPRSPKAHFDLGRAFAQLGQFAEAAAALRQAIRIDDQFLDAVRWLGDVLDRAGDAAGAIEAIHYVAQREPESAEIRDRLGKLLADQWQSQVGVVRQELGTTASNFGRAAAKSSIDVIILSYAKTRKEYDMTARCVRTLHASEPESVFNVIVVETNSRDQLRAYARHSLFGGNCGVIFPEAAFNYNIFLQMAYEVLRSSPSETLLIANNDVLFENGFCRPLLAALKRYDSVSPWCPGYHEQYMDGNVGEHLGFRVTYEVCGWALMMNKSLFLQIPFGELFPDAFPFWYQDDYYAYRLEQAGFRHALIRASRVHHLFRQSYSLIDSSQYEAFISGAQERFEAFLASQAETREVECADGTGTDSSVPPRPDSSLAPA